jgi:hypothetical protein
MKRRRRWYVLICGQQHGTLWPILNEDGSLRLFASPIEADEVASNDIAGRFYGRIVRSEMVEAA